MAPDLTLRGINRWYSKRPNPSVKDMTIPDIGQNGETARQTMQKTGLKYVQYFEFLVGRLIFFLLNLGIQSKSTPHLIFQKRFIDKLI